MAKKKQALSPEERLAAALVPEKEWPYALPDGWKWVRIGALNDYKSSSITPSTNPDDTFELYSVPSIVNDYPEITKGMDIGSTKQLVEKDDVLLCKINPRINRVWKVSAHTTHKCLASSEWIVVRARSFFASDYLMWFFRCPYFRERMLSNVSGVGGSLMRAKPRYVQTYPVALPPLSEQHRLVARIESLFAKLDAAREKVQSVLDSHETRKAALLHDAFAGKLTAKWREERGIPQSWKNGKLLDCLLEKPRNGYSPKAVNYPTKCKSMSLSATTDGIFKKEYYKYIDEEIPADSYLWLEPGDILIQRSNSLEKVGISAIYTGGTHEYIYPDLMMKLQVNNQNDPAYINYFLQRAETRAYFLSNATGIAGNMPKINQKTVSNTPVNYPSLAEQQEIVRILGRLLAREQRARQAAEETLTAIDCMKQAILARAFRGEL